MTDLLRKLDIAGMTADEIKEYCVSVGEKPFRAAQIYKWLRKGISSFDEMTDVSAALREKLKNDCFIAGCTTVRTQISSDGTRKYLFELYDGERIESVFMQYEHGNTVCISTQAGCRMGCSFCASTIDGLKRNLLPSEMLAQIIAAQNDTGNRVSNIVLMGMGEPLDNYDNVMRFIRLANDPQGLGIGMRHISLSTCGLIEQIDRLADENLQITLSVSLHAPNGEIRSTIMPIARRYGYEELLEACLRYEKKTGRRISFEYALIDGVNDRVCDADELGRRLRGTLCHVNLIPLNSTARKIYKRSEKKSIDLFTKTLEKYKITVTVRRRLGNDISASCGQLRAEDAGRL